MSFLLSVVGLLIVVWALTFLVVRRHRRTIAPGNAGTQPAHAAGASTAGPWSRSDRIALASLVVGAVLGVLGLFAG